MISPRKGKLSSLNSNHQKFIYKIIDGDSIQIYCGTRKPTDFQVNKLLDEWIYLTPKTPNIVTAYEVFKDNFLYL